MSGDGQPDGWWREPEPPSWTVLLRGVGLTGLLLVVGVSGVLENWDGLVVAGVLALALVVDLWPDLRPRYVVAAGADGLVVMTRRTTRVPWDEVDHVTTVRRWPLAPLPVLVRTDGRRVVLPAALPPGLVERWVTEQRR